MPNHRGIHGWRWSECSTCGFHWPLHQLKKDYTGNKRCPKCLDPKGFEEALADLTPPIEDNIEETYYEDII